MEDVFAYHREGDCPDKAASKKPRGPPWSTKFQRGSLNKDGTAMGNKMIVYVDIYLDRVNSKGLLLTDEDSEVMELSGSFSFLFCSAAPQQAPRACSAKCCAPAIKSL